MEYKILTYLQETYSQDNTIPESFDVEIDGKRVHIETYSCGAIAAWENHNIAIVELSEDDGYFHDVGVDNYSSGWLTPRRKMYERMENYLLENCEPQYYSGFEGVETHKCGFKSWKN